MSQGVYILHLRAIVSCTPLVHTPAAPSPRPPPQSSSILIQHGGAAASPPPRQNRCNRRALSASSLTSPGAPGLAGAAGVGVPGGFRERVALWSSGKADLAGEQHGIGGSSKPGRSPHISTGPYIRPLEARHLGRRPEVDLSDAAARKTATKEWRSREFELAKAMQVAMVFTYTSLATTPAYSLFLSGMAEGARTHGPVGGGKFNELPIRVAAAREVFDLQASSSHFSGCSIDEATGAVVVPVSASYLVISRFIPVQTEA